MSKQQADRIVGIVATAGLSAVVAVILLKYSFKWKALAASAAVGDGDGDDAVFEARYKNCAKSSRVYSGTCHCQRVRFRVTAPSPVLKAVDVPSKIRFPRLSVPRAAFEPLSDDATLSMYAVRSDDTEGHAGGGVGIYTFCSHCGVHVLFSPSLQPAHLHVNAECLDLRGVPVPLGADQTAEVGAEGGSAPKDQAQGLKPARLLVTHFATPESLPLPLAPFNLRGSGAAAQAADSVSRSVQEYAAATVSSGDAGCRPFFDAEQEAAMFGSGGEAREAQRNAPAAACSFASPNAAQVRAPTTAPAPADWSGPQVHTVSPDTEAGDKGRGGSGETTAATSLSPPLQPTSAGAQLQSQWSQGAQNNKLDGSTMRQLQHQHGGGHEYGYGYGYGYEPAQLSQPLGYQSAPGGVAPAGGTPDPFLQYHSMAYPPSGAGSGAGGNGRGYGGPPPRQYGGGITPRRTGFEPSNGYGYGSAAGSSNYKPAASPFSYGALFGDEQPTSYGPQMQHRHYGYEEAQTRPAAPVAPSSSASTGVGAARITVASPFAAASHSRGLGLGLRQPELQRGSLGQGAPQGRMVRTPMLRQFSRHLNHHLDQEPEQGQGGRRQGGVSQRLHYLSEEGEAAALQQQQMERPASASPQHLYLHGRQLAAEDGVNHATAGGTQLAAISEPSSPSVDSIQGPNAGPLAEAASSATASAGASLPPPSPSHSLTSHMMGRVKEHTIGGGGRVSSTRSSGGESRRSSGAGGSGGKSVVAALIANINGGGGGNVADKENMRL